MVVPGGVGGAALVLLVVLLIGVAMGRSRARFLLLFAGLVAIGAGAVILASVGGSPDKAAAMARFYTIFVPVGTALLAGWLCAKGSWFKRLIVLALAAILVAVFPSDAAGRASAGLIKAAPVSPAPAQQPPVQQR